MPAASQADRLMSQVYHLPAIIGRLGLNIAEAQKELNADYIATVTKIFAIAGAALTQNPADTPENARESLRSLLEMLLPSRYQYTETTLDFSADLSESKSMAGSVAAGAAMGAFMVNASFALGYGYDYRAAARVTTVIHAHPIAGDRAKMLLDRAKEIKADKLTLPPVTQADKEIWKQLQSFYKVATGKDLESPTEKPANGEKPLPDPEKPQ